MLAGLLPFIIGLGLLIALDILALRYGADSRGGDASKQIWW